MAIEIAVSALGAIMIGQNGEHFASESECPISIEFRYDPNDPLAVTLAFTDDHAGSEIEWTFARDLIFEALNKGKAGDEGSDVKLSRVLYGPNSLERISVWLSSPDGTALVYLPRPPMALFAEQVELRLPTAELAEKLTADMDAELAKLLEQA